MIVDSAVDEDLVNILSLSAAAISCSMVKLGPRAYMWGSAAYNAVRFFMPIRVTAAEVLKQRSAARQCLYAVQEVRALLRSATLFAYVAPVAWLKRLHCTGRLFTQSLEHDATE